jgi:antitoxin VapB
VTLNIKDPETHKLAQQLARETGQSMTKAVTEAIRNQLDEVRRRKQKRGMAEDLLAIGRRCASKIKGPVISHEDLLYDERGLPK